MTTPENRVKAFIDQRMKIWYPDAVKYSPPGGRFGKAGFPDRLWFIRANDLICVVVAIEAKALGNEATQMQIHTLTKLEGQGVLTAIITGRDEERMDKIREGIQYRIRRANEEVE